MLPNGNILYIFGLFTKGQSVAIFLFWRLSYNIGLGLLLRSQSLYSTLTNWFDKYSNNIKYKKWMYWLASCGYPKGFDPKNYPSSFNAWVIFKNLVTIILVNDGCNYILLGFQFFNMPKEITWGVILQYVFGLVLAFVNYYSKTDAHRCIGSYCWYYGDFFFRKEQSLTFDGIFELFPHPMYTVGYSLYYGYSLLCESYQLLFVSLIAHMLQLGFLIFVEQPHINRIYGEQSNNVDKETEAILYDKKDGLFPEKSDSLFFSIKYVKIQ